LTCSCCGVPAFSAQEAEVADMADMARSYGVSDLLVYASGKVGRWIGTCAAWDERVSSIEREVRVWVCSRLPVAASASGWGPTSLMNVLGVQRLGKIRGSYGERSLTDLLCEKYSRCFKPSFSITLNTW
jgi:hypothetical protein